MIDLDFTRLWKLLQAGDAETKKKYWRSLPARHEAQRFTRAEVRTLEDLALAEKEQDLARCATLSLAAVYAIGGVVAGEKQAENPAETLADWLFEPFREEAGVGDHVSLVLSVCDEHHLRDVQAQVEIARLLPSERYPHTRFRHVPEKQPDWSGLGQARGVCFIGRPQMFENCKIIEHFPKDLRFSIVPPESGKKEDFHCVVQNRPEAGLFRYNTVEEEGSHRHDYAIVQRFTIKFGGRDVIVLVIAGGSSLGTLGAARWISNYKWTRKTRDRFARVAGLGTIDRETRFEALIEVTARVHKPARPWDPPYPLEKSLFLQKSRNLLKAPARVTLGIEKEQLAQVEEVRYLLFDDDEMDFSPKDKAAVVALCMKCFLEGRREIAIEDLVSDARVWRNGDRPARDKAVTFLRDHLQRHGLNITVSADSIRLPAGCKIETTLAA
ncbi:MAG: hypothetical protein WCC27_19425 [Acidobacteriaceae bacterium]